MSDTGFYRAVDQGCRLAFFGHDVGLATAFVTVLVLGFVLGLLVGWPWGWRSGNKL